MKVIGELPMSREDIQRILAAPIVYSNKSNPKEEEQVQAMVKSLTKEQLEFAAQSSYAYWLASVSNKPPPTPHERLHMARKEARRFLFGNDYGKAYREYHESCDFRKDYNIGVLRACIADWIVFETEEETKLAEIFRSFIVMDLAKQSAFVRGHDKDGFAMLIVKPRSEKSTNDEAFVATQVFVVERAIATTEALSQGKREMMVVVLDFGKFKSSLAPPWSAIKAIVAILQHRYSERLKRLVIIDPPFWMRTIYGLLRPFLDPDTCAKFVLVSGDKQKTNVFSGFLDSDQAMPFMLPNGTISDSVDIDRFLRTVPFHCLYDDASLAAAVAS